MDKYKWDDKRLNMPMLSMMCHDDDKWKHSKLCGFNTERHKGWFMHLAETIENED